MGGFFGAVSRKNCKYDVFFGTDYHSHLGTARGGMAAFDPEIRSNAHGDIGMVYMKRCIFRKQNCTERQKISLGLIRKIDLTIFNF